MSHSYSKLIYHCVWGTKRRYPFMISSFKKNVHRVVADMVEKEGGTLFSIGGVDYHIHLLFSIKPSDSISRFLRNVKSYSSKTIRQSHVAMEKFFWQEGYSIFTVSPSQCDKAVDYIKKQEFHHRNRSFDDELLILLERNGVEYDPQFLYG